MNKNDYVTHQELELTTEKILHHMDNRFAEIDKKIDHRFAEMDKRFAEVNLNISEAKNIANSVDSKANWIIGILTTVIAGVIIAAINTLLHINWYFQIKKTGVLDMNPTETIEMFIIDLV